MADNRKKIVLEGQDAGVGSMMQRLKAQSQELSRGLLQDSKQYSLAGKDSLRYLEDQIKTIERRNKLESEGAKLAEQNKLSQKLATATTGMERQQATDQYKSRIADIERGGKQDEMQTKLLRDISENIKELAREELMADPKGVRKAIRSAERRDFAGLDEEEATKLQMQKQLIEEGKPAGRGASMFSQFLGAQVLRDAGAIIQQVPNARSGMDLVSPVASLTGMVGGGLAGIGVGALAGSFQTGTSGTAAGRGAMEGLAIGSELGKQVGQFAGSALTRHLQEREQMQQPLYSLMNRLGYRPEMVDMANMGMSYSESLSLQEEAVSGRGGAVGGRELQRVLATRAAGIERNTAMRFFEMERTGGGRASQELARLISVLEDNSNVNRAIYNDIADNQISLMSSMRQTQNVVSGQEALSTIMSFNQIGGQFSARNPNSLQNIQNVRQSMISPQNEFVRARQFALLREQNPDADFYQLLEMMQQPTPEMMQMFLSDEGMAGMPEGARQFALAQAYGGGNMQRGRSLMGFRALGAEGGDMNFQNMIATAISRTPEFQQQEARISNAYASDALEGVQQVTKEFGNTIDLIYEKEMEKIDLETTVTNKLDEVVDKMGGWFTGGNDKPDKNRPKKFSGAM